MTATEQPIALVTGATGGMGVEFVREPSLTHRVLARSQRQAARARVVHA